MTEETTALTPQHHCTTKDLWRLRLDNDAIDDCKLLKVTYALFSTEKAYSHEMLQIKESKTVV